MTPNLNNNTPTLNTLTPSTPTLNTPPLNTGVRLRDHIALRWLACIGQSAAVFVAYVLFDLPLPLAPISACIALSASLNLWLIVKHKGKYQNLSNRQATYYLCYDLVQLTALLGLTGGLANPFAVLLLAPVTVTASIGEPRATLAVMVCAVLAVIVLFISTSFYAPIDFAGLPFYATAQAAGLVLALIFIPAYVWWVSRAGRQLMNANAAMASLLERAHHLSALDGLAAAAAHELGTPLGTIFLTSGELAKSNMPAAIKEDVQLIRAEAEKCRVILSNLSRGDKFRNDKGSDNDIFSTTSLDDMMHSLIEAVSPQKLENKHIYFTGAKNKTDNLSPLYINTLHSRTLHIRTLPELIYGIGNVLDNALSYSHKNVWVDVAYDAHEVTITIKDDGAGFAPDILARLGTPYNKSNHKSNNRDTNKESMGLGFFIAQSLLARLGGVVNASNLDKGAQVIIKVPLASLTA